MSDDEEDYMSEKFLSCDVRPSLIQDHSRKRQVETTKKHQAQIKRQRQESSLRKGTTNNEQLQESLKKPIAAENKGFQLLAKMGYKPGQALGKAKAAGDETTKEQRLIEPIGISIKAGRGGLGREAALKELDERRRALREQRLRQNIGKNETLTTEEYRRRATQKAEERFTVGALKRCQLTCENLDTAAKLEAPEMCWFWPQRELEETAEPEDEKATTSSAPDEVEEEEYSNAEKLELLTSYLRTSYLFCFWCGVQYNDQTDFEDNCPGKTRDEH